MNFTKYWEINKELFEQLNVTKAVVKKIWNDAIDAVQMEIIKDLIK